ncbi:MAG: hypothetical protein FD123_4377 [Bacteroidetes bacterium]|nr:MAG: hypothetical protein FD123_4377 [Bacteroidota bacterium]
MPGALSLKEKNMLIRDFEFVQIYAREIGRLKDELNAFTDEPKLWKTAGEMKNSAGNLALHLCGNLNHFIGAVLGQTGFVRERDKEFSDKNISREELLRRLDETGKTLTAVLEKLNDDDLLKPYPLNAFGEGTKTVYVLVQLLAHFNYHLGQVNAQRRSL